MPLLAGILSVLALLLAAATIVGVIAPSLFRNRKTGQVPKRLSVLVWGALPCSWRWCWPAASFRRRPCAGDGRGCGK
ncbi:hypothetical protein ACFSHR_05385 [Azotobacter chroococcum]